MTPAAPRLSIVLPVRNDAAALGRALDHLSGLQGIADCEVIVAAAGDREATERVAAGRARVLWPSGSTRATLMNAGAAAARGPVLLFLHADSFPPVAARSLVERALADARVVGGAFEHLFAEPSWSLRLITWINRVRYRVTRNYYGDQGLFVRAGVFRALGGYRDLRLMEDLDFSQRLKRCGRTVLIREPLRTSGRRFLARGPWRTFFFIVWLLARHTLGLDTQRYAERWRGPADRAPGTPWTGRRSLLGPLLVLAAAAPAGAQPALLAELEAFATRYHEDPARLDTLRERLVRAVGADPRADHLVALARVSFIWGDIRAADDGQKLAAYDQGRTAARQALEAAPGNVAAHFWYATNTARWGQTKGVIRSLFLLPTVREEIRTVIDLDPGFTAVYALAGNVDYEVPGLLGGDLERAEKMFRTGLGQDPKFTGLRVGLAKTLIRTKRFAEARRELQAVLDERAPRNLADWTMKDSREARRLLDAIQDRR